ncbi:MAG: hypothetical protein QM750_11090 [Rubrivivax sp.]
MKIALNFVVSVLALGTLLGSTASQATKVAELPLKASVLAKPNIVYGIDDSGSMDWEVLLSTSSGLMWWNGSTAWDTAAGKPLFGGGTEAKYAYLFPVGWIPAASPAGDAPGGGIYGSSETYYKVVPPTPDFAWTRSAAFNPQYYDTEIDYKPWAPAYYDGALNPSFPDSPSAAAKIHPTEPGAPAMNLTQQWNSANAGGKWTTGGYRFYVEPGMKVPAGSRLNASSKTSGACEGSTERDITAELTPAANKRCFASIPYYPATFWHAQNCTVDGSTCVLAPDGTTKLKRYEIKSGNTFPSGRTYENEIKNFANWFTYYRKRKLSLAGSMGTVLENLTGVRMGTMRFSDAALSSPPSITMLDADATDASLNRLRTVGDFYRLTPDQAATPTHKTMQVIGDQYDTNTSIVEYACQRNAMFVVTDGFANAPSGVTVPTYDQATHGNTAPYKTTPAGSLADLGLDLLHQAAPCWRHQAAGRGQSAAELVDGAQRRQEPQPARQHLRHLAGRLGHDLADGGGPVRHRADLADAGGRHAEHAGRPVACHRQRPRPDDAGQQPDQHRGGHPRRHQRHPQPGGRPGRRGGQHRQPAARRLQGLLRHLQPRGLDRRPDGQPDRQGQRRRQHHRHLVGRHAAAGAQLDHARDRQLQRQQRCRLHRGRRRQPGQPQPGQCLGQHH